MKSNSDIIAENLELIRRCVECQFAKKGNREEFMEDFYHDLIIMLYDYDNDKMNNALENNHLNALMTRIIQNNIFSVTSPYYKKYIKHQVKSEEITSKHNNIPDDEE